MPGELETYSLYLIVKEAQKGLNRDGWCKMKPRRGRSPVNETISCTLLSDRKNGDSAVKKQRKAEEAERENSEKEREPLLGTHVLLCSTVVIQPASQSELTTMFTVYKIFLNRTFLPSINFLTSRSGDVCNNR